MLSNDGNNLVTKKHKRKSMKVRNEKINVTGRKQI
jgi:hypothetical protein